MVKEETSIFWWVVGIIRFDDVHWLVAESANMLTLLAANNTSILVTFLQMPHRNQVLLQFTQITTQSAPSCHFVDVLNSNTRGEG